MGFISWLKNVSRGRVSNEISDTTTKAEGIVSPEGMGVLASVGGNKLERPNFFKNNTVTFKETSNKSVTFSECGHQCSLGFEVSIWGNIHGFKFKDERIKKMNGIETAESICPKCYFEKLKQAAIRCCLCGYGILPGDGVALYHKSSKGVNKGVSTFVDDSAVGCLLWDCCPSGGFYAGYWTFEGFKSAFGDNSTGAEKAFTTGQIVSGNIK
ncbi:MAG: hypothetical protein COV29_01015 [Candidatus Yanofskybacteria bacterium CG10_big_fil_rev_8_21_14_0_10_36_16]|uniref:Uncharacterized protein n=1 Tax=Candidatus Yanofskybacteria bacterium CG10_big_fil_rev_8_21_14_0_10_36_16 TaxID=1975096 RepID=A0A2J0Q8G3_9BACT|nr:MAG: hypothetical protein COV29_01015 [Candidatus Yanofskybacteria bacterium CG10_big_fil_rev_8_21_14_0_10_36_16]